MGRYKQDKENAALMQGAYCAYVTKSKRKFDNVLRRIYPFRSSKQLTYVKMGRYKQDAEREENLREFTLRK